MLTTGQEFTFTICRGVGTADCVSVNYDDFVNDVEVGDMLLVDGTIKVFFRTHYRSNCICMLLDDTNSTDWFFSSTLLYRGSCFVNIH